jgi:hypothetical protein
LRDRLVPHFQRLRIERPAGTSDEQLQSLAHELLPINQSFRASADIKTGMTLSELVDVYLKDRAKNIDDRTILNMRYTFDLLLWIIGDVPVKSISRPQCRECRDMLLRLLARALSDSDKLSPDEVIGLNKTPMNPKTTNKNIQFVSALFRWAVNEELLEDNPARNLSITIKKKASLERKAYGIDDLRELFSRLPSHADYLEEYWLPLMGNLVALNGKIVT